jgi:hypothetical protein
VFYNQGPKGKVKRIGIHIYDEPENNTSKTSISMLEATVLRKTWLKLYLGFIRGTKTYRA